MLRNEHNEKGSKPEIVGTSILLDQARLEADHSFRGNFVLYWRYQEVIRELALWHTEIIIY
jgi:hypothetical protein